MKKKLLTIALLASGIAVQAQTVLMHVDDAAKVFVSNGTLVYNGGGLQTRGSGNIDLRGNMMIERNAAGDVVRNINTSATPGIKSDGGNIILRLNDPTDVVNSTYGQLYINGFIQTELNGATISKEFKARRHGAVNGSYFQQIAMPFSGKVLNTLSTEFGKTFGVTRWTQNEILTWNNALVRSDHFTNLATATSNPTAYYMLGSKNGNLNAETPPSTLPTIAPTATGSVFTLNGRPYSSQDATANPLTVTLAGAGAGIDFGTNGNALNGHNERYYTYLQDNLETTAGGGAWSTNYGKNMYQFGNPFLTNLDLSKIGYNEGVNGDGNNISNIWGVRYDPGTVATHANGSTYSTDALIQTFSNVAPNVGTPVGDVGLIIKPMQAFVIKLRDNTSQTLNFNTLRRFSSSVRAAGTPYNVSAAKTTNTNNSGNTIKQLGVIALNSDGKEVGRTYYVVSAGSITGHQPNNSTSVQAGNSGGNLIGTFEEALTGGYDFNYTSAYWLYINEANEVDFLGKNVKLANYDYGVSNTAVSYKFEIRENAELVAPGTHLLSGGHGFYFKAPNGTPQQIMQDAVVPITGDEYDLYYGQPSGTLANEEVKKPSRTMVIYNPGISNYIVRFDENWKKADIQVFDMSGKLVISRKDVETSKDFVIELDGSVRNSYVVKIVSDSGETVNTKILK